MSFLKAEWKKLALANYEVEPEILKPYVPYGTELDLWQGRCYMSLVGFMFINTRLLGVPVPGHINFEEVNLRFYVKRVDRGEVKRGVVFIKEIVPRAAITFIANNIYKENYETMKMGHEWAQRNSRIDVSYKWKRRGGKWNSFSVSAPDTQHPLVKGSETEFITEHYWGYAKVSDSQTNEYEVTHPRWNVYGVDSHQIDVDFAEVYGKEFRFLNAAEPLSVMLAEGSLITVEKKRELG
jgi:uncharacterized protein YqjF (DUF2071 family)